MCDCNLGYCVYADVSVVLNQSWRTYVRYHEEVRVARRLEGS